MRAVALVLAGFCAVAALAPWGGRASAQGDFASASDSASEALRQWRAKTRERFSKLAAPPAPPTLSQTGLYSDIRRKLIAPGNETFTPQFPLWSDGAGKSRWIHLPPGTR